jgi:primosomal protein N' (replication factor Y) (superfamily II helicase)
MSIAHVALPLPLRRTFAYSIPDALVPDVHPGAQVDVPFRARRRRGIVTGVDRDSVAPDPTALHPISAVLEREAVSAHVLELAAWIADYYLAPIGEVLVATLPGGLEGFARSRARKAAVEDRAVRLALPDRIRPSAGQRAAIDAANAALAAGGFAPLLLHGVTASGKTEIYLRAALTAREQGRQTLLLVPEVALSAQLVGEFERRFGGRVGVLHSYLTVGERRRNWELAHRGGLDVVVGARSAVFAPLARLGLIVVDEEHEPAYKQSERLRYHARDVAVRRAQMLGIPVLLGSATPSLESRANAARGKYQSVRLPERFDRRPLPHMRVVDLRRETGAPGLLSAPLSAAIADRLERREQILLYLNRRGHSHHVQCRACGHVPECPYCDIALTLHVEPRALKCHYCDHQQVVPDACSECRGRMFRYSGSGTQRAERELRTAFPSARLLRLDTDVSRARDDVRKIITQFRKGDADILIGTQMVAKGFDFPGITLVGVLDADVGLHLPDFRSGERTYQLLVQVSGRAGRGRVAGEVVVQTCTPEHPAIAAAVLHDDRKFLDHELTQRRDAGYPPFVRLVALLFSGPSESAVARTATEAATLLREGATVASPIAASLLDFPAPGMEMATEPDEDIRVLGPAPHALARIRGQHRWHVLLKSADGRRLHEAARRVLEHFEGSRRPGAVRIGIDVDPIDVL